MLPTRRSCHYSPGLRSLQIGTKPDLYETNSRVGSNPLFPRFDFRIESSCPGPPMTMRRIFLLIGIACTFIGNSARALSDKNSRIKLTQTGDDVTITFHDKDGQAIKKVSQSKKELRERGHRIYFTVDVTLNPAASHVILSQEARDVDERNPYTIRKSSSVRFSWYQEDGHLLCSMHSRMKPVALSGNGRVLVSTDLGIEPTMFEQWHEVPGLESIDDLRNDRFLRHGRLSVLNDSCQIQFSTVSRIGGWDTILISTSGMWLLLGESESSNATPSGSWKRMMTAVNTTTRLSHAVIFDQLISPKTISNDGHITGEKYLGPGSIYTYKAADGSERKARRRKLQRFEWVPGGAFEPAGAEVEE